MEYKKIFKNIAKDYIKRKGIDELLDMLDKTDFYTAPASTKYHDSEEGGLVKHSVKVFEELWDEVYNELSIDKHCSDELSEESIAIVALFHDLCKIGYYKTEMRNTKDENGKWVQVPYYTIDDKLPLGHGAKSIILISEYMKLTTDEMLAIMHHMGGFSPKEEYSTLSKAYAECPLALYLHIADMKATYLKED